MSEVLTSIYRQGSLGVLDYHFALSMGRIAKEDKAVVLLAAALVSRELGRGQVCLDVGSGHTELESMTKGALKMPSFSSWIKMVEQSPLVSVEAQAREGNKAPLVLDSGGRLYLHRYWLHEYRLAQFILGRAKESTPLLNDKVLSAGLTRLFPALEDGAFDYQRLAALMAVRRRFCVISGGPGTGKTFTLVKILALLIEQEFSFGNKCPRILLLAPTGKAALRMVESIRKSKANLDCTSKVKAAIEEKSSTIHRCLGSIGGSSTEFRHHQQRPLETDLVLVDEASMVNLALMRRLVDALPDHARLILLGDMNQLASVEAGAVLGDICNTGRERVYSDRLHFDLGVLGGPILSGARQSKTGLWDCVVSLQKSYRFEEGSGIGRLAAAIYGGDAEEALEILEVCEDVERVSCSSPEALYASIQKSAVLGYQDYLDEADVNERFLKFESYRILCARKSGPFGVGKLNEVVEDALEEAGKIKVSSDNYLGRPILVGANDYELGLFNGDIGLLLSHENASPGQEMVEAVFLSAEGHWRHFSPSRLETVQTAFAMSVHKSQGSEFNCIDVVLPEHISPLLTRELLYTAVTRAKKKVRIYGSKEVIRHAIESPTKRLSGLRSALWGKAGEEVGR